MTGLCIDGFFNLPIIYSYLIFLKKYTKSVHLKVSIHQESCRCMKMFMNIGVPNMTVRFKHNVRNSSILKGLWSKCMRHAETNETLAESIKQIQELNEWLGTSSLEKAVSDDSEPLQKCAIFLV